MKAFTLLTSLLCCLAVAAHSRCQAQEMLTTIGATVDIAGARHAYILWQPQGAEEALVRKFGIYSKPGTAEGTGVFVRESIQTLQSSPRTVRAMLELGSKIDRDPLGAATRIDAIFREITQRAGAVPPPAGNVDAADKLVFIIQSAVTQPRLLNRLFFLGRAHAGVMLALGHAFTKPMPEGQRTYEVRELSDSDTDLRVLGRVTLDPNAPLVLPAPGAPVRVFHAITAGSQFPVSSKDHLNARLRWGMNDDLRALLPHTFGFEIFRVKATTAETFGWHSAPPLAGDLLNLLGTMDPTDLDPAIASASELPVLVNKPLTILEAANPNNQDTTHFADDGVLHTTVNGRRERREFSDGESFYYFIAARDITGRPGLVSPGLRVIICDRLPPAAPRIDSINSVYASPEDKATLVNQAGAQFLRITFRQLPENQEEGASRYHIYRWGTPQEYLSHLADANFNKIGEVAHQTGKRDGTFDDLGLPSTQANLDKTFWYTIRAVGHSACTPETVGAHSGPMPGILRDLRAPDRPSGSVTVQRRTVITSRILVERPGTKRLENFVGVNIRGIRNGLDVAAFIIEVALKQPDGNFTVVHRRQHVFQTANTLDVNLPYKEPEISAKAMRIRVTPISATGTLGQTVEQLFFSSGKHDFVTYQVTFTTALSSEVVAPNIETPHVAHDADGRVNFILGTVGFANQNKIREWRVYRRVGNDGELSLIAKGEGAPKEEGKPVRTINPDDAGKLLIQSIPDGAWKDDALPAAPGTVITYYGQLFDQNGNGSPMTVLGVIRIASPHLPVPMLASVKRATKSITPPLVGKTQIDLKWVCDPVGVERFEVLVSSEREPSDIIGLVRAPQIVTLQSEVGNDIGALFLPNHDLPFRAYQTVRVGGDIGKGPEFTTRVTLPDEIATPLTIAVRAVGHGSFPRAAGAPSNRIVVAPGTISEGPNDGVIPWPARPLPPVISGVLPPTTIYGEGEGSLLPFPAPSFFNASTMILIGAVRGNCNVSRFGTSYATPQTAPRPEEFLFKLRTEASLPGSSQPLGGFMLYRYQLPSARFPNAKPNVVQCTPLVGGTGNISFVNQTIEGIDFRKVNDPFFRYMDLRPDEGVIPGFKVTFLDPGPTFVTIASVPNLSEIQALPGLAGAEAAIWLLDPLPVTKGARYQYLLCLFESGEIARVIELPVIQH
jgi:hypothetical protein